MAGVDGATPIRTAMDCLTVIVMEVPGDQLKKWRTELDAALHRVQPPSRETWGTLPEQQAGMLRLMGDGFG